MGTRVRFRFWAESVLGCVGAALAVLTLAWPDWIEGLTGMEPDRGDGSMEWAIVLGFVTVSVVVGLAARREWRRARMAVG